MRERKKLSKNLKESLMSIDISFVFCFRGVRQISYSYYTSHEVDPCFEFVPVFSPSSPSPIVVAALRIEY